MPVAIGFHPYFQLTDSTRDEWTISVGARTQWLLASNKIPTGETEPIEKLFPDPQAIALKDFDLDHVFGDLVRDGKGRAVMTVKGKSQRLDVLLGPNYRSVVIYAPQAGCRATGGCSSAGRRRTRPECRGAKPELHLLRADGRHHRCDEPGAEGALQGAAEHPARRRRGRRASGSDRTGFELSAVSSQLSAE